LLLAIFRIAVVPSEGRFANRPYMGFAICMFHSEQNVDIRLALSV
jgi:hypothetical protein